MVMPISGWVVDVLMSETDASGGESLIFIAWHQGLDPTRDGIETWSGHRIAGGRSVYEASLPSSQHLRQGQRASLSVRVQHGADGKPGFFPVRIRHVDGRREFFAWDGERLEVVPDEPEPTEPTEP